MKVLHLLASNKYSGAENVVCQIIKMFDGEIEMAYCSPNGEIKKTLENMNIQFFPLEKLNVKNLKKVVAEFKPDIIHAHDIRACTVASRIKKIKKIAHIHVNNVNMNKVSVRSLILKFISSKFDNIIWVSKSCLDNFKFKESVKNKSLVLENVIDPESVLNKIKDENVKKFDIIYLGRLTEQKDPLRLVEILSQVKIKLPEIKIALVGDGNLREEVYQKIDELGLQNNVVKFGFLNNPYEVLNQSKLMLMSSLREGTPMCAIESMILGVPVVSTPTDGMKDLIINKKNGIIYTTNEQAVSNIVWLLKSAQELNKMSSFAKDFATKYNDLSGYKQKIKKVYGV